MRLMEGVEVYFHNFIKIFSLHLRKKAYNSPANWGKRLSFNL